jgi:hypothetical protein
LIDQEEVNDAERRVFYETMAERMQEEGDMLAELTGASADAGRS